MADSGLTRIGRYELRERIGSGGMARVYKAWDTTLQRLVAIKILHEHLADDPTFMERFEREARFVANFNHPNIVQVYDFDSITRDGIPQYYMVMSYVAGHTLRQELDAVAGKPLPYDRTSQIAHNLSDALGYAHEHGMVHRDVKPGNVLIDEKGQAILTDFGIARLVQSTRLTQEGVSTGTPAYMSPEQASGQAGDARSDLYSLAVILFEMLTGAPPYLDEGTMAVMLKHLTADIPAYSERTGRLDPALDAFFARGLAKDANSRFQTASELHQAFAAALEGQSPEQSNDSDIDTVAFLPAIAAPAVVAAPPPPATTQLSGVIAKLAQTARRSPRTSGGILALGGVLTAVLFAVLLVNHAGQAAPDAAPTFNPENVPSITGENFFYSQFAPAEPESAYWPQEELPALTQAIMGDGLYRLSNEVPNTAESIIYRGGDSYGDSYILMEATLDASSAHRSAYGIVFRYQDPDNYNVFAVNGEGHFSIWVRQHGMWRELRGVDGESWTPNSAILPIGQKNRLTLAINENTLTGYVNGEEVVRITDDTFGPGRVGIYLGSDDGASNVLVDEYRVRDSIISMTGWS